MPKFDSLLALGLFARCAVKSYGLGQSGVLRVVRPFCCSAISRDSAIAKAAMMSSDDAYKSIVYTVHGRVAHIMLNRPHRYNAIDIYMPFELERAVEAANLDTNVKVILLYGNKVFCSGYDLKVFAEGERAPKDSSLVGGAEIALLSQSMPWDPYTDFKFMSRCNRAWMSLWHSQKPVVCKIKGVAIGGGSDMALCCDITFIADDARFGYPPTRVWGCPTTAMWFYRVGMERARRILYTGQILSGTEAARIDLIGESVPEQELDQAVDKFIERMINVPTNQLFFQKQVVNQAVEQMGLAATQRLATVFDGLTRHTPEGIAFQQRAFEVGFKQAVRERDSGEDAVWSNMDIPDGGKSKL